VSRRKATSLARPPTGRTSPTGDLLILCACKNWQAVLEEVLARPHALGIRPLRGAVVRHFTMGHDAGIRMHGPAVARSQVLRFDHALLVLDYHGSGATAPAEMVQDDLSADLAQDWQDRAAAVVVEPELEAWLIGAGKHFASLVDAQGLDARNWWRNNAFWLDGAAKPADPKAAVESLLAAHHRIRSGPNYRYLARRASLRPDACVTPSFKHFVSTLRGWFPPDPEAP